MNRKKRLLTISGIILIIIIVLIIAFVIVKKNKDNTETTETTTDKQTETTTEEIETEISRENMMHSYLTGEWVDNSIGLKKPMAVMINNIKAGLPATSISNASIVYEAPVEGGITRLLGIYEDYNNLDKIGSVRSARTYYVYLALEYEPIFLHFGAAHYAEPLLKNSKINNLSGTDGIGRTVYYRTTDKVSPHNAYSSSKGINAGIEQLNYDTKQSSTYGSHFLFAQDNLQNNLESGSPAVKINVGYRTNAPWFEYNDQDQKYYRYQYNDKQIDDMNNQHISYKNIILQYCNYSYYDGNGYLNIDVVSGGSGKYISNGKSIDITWKKDSEHGKTRFYDQNANEIILNQGKTWICIIKNDDISKIQIN